MRYMENKRLYQPKYMREILEKFGFSFSKSLGQNFLIDGNIIRKIVDNSEITEDDVVLEIGPGFGVLTEELASKAKHVVCVEIDKSLMEVLDYTLKDFDNVDIINDDILKVDIKAIKEKYSPDRKMKVVANLPYYVTTPILEHLIDDKEFFDSITVMVQKEVADRMAAKENTKAYGSLSLYIGYNADAEIIVRAPKTVFMPQPKIDSAVVKLNLVKRDFGVDEKLLFDLIHSGFTKRRKNIMNSLTTGFVKITKDELKVILEKLDIPANLRAENLSLEQYVLITKEIEKNS